MKSPKLPAIQFYPGDWLKDPLLRCVSVAARGLWIDCLCLMHESPNRGHLELPNGQPMSAEHVSRMTGVPQKDVERLLSELDAVGVLSRKPNGVIYSRRMVRDEDFRQMRRRAGQAGNEKRWGSPSQDDSQTVSQTPRKTIANGIASGIANASQNRRPSSSVSSSRTHKETHNTHTPRARASGDGEGDEKRTENRGLEGTTPTKEDVLTWWNGLAAKANPALPVIDALPRERWNRFLARRDEGFWERREIVAQKILASDHLQGRNGHRNGHGTRSHAAPWRVSFDWLTDGQINWRKVADGNYDAAKRKPQLETR